MTKLNELETGQRGRVARVSGSNRFLSRVSAIGLTEGCEFEVLQNAKKRPVLIYLRDSSVAFDRKDCENIDVEVCS